MRRYPPALRSLLCLFMLLPSVVWAAKKPYDLLTLYHLAQAHDPTLLAAQATRQATHTEIPTARADLLPSLKLNSAASRTWRGAGNEQITYAHSLSVDLSQSVFEFDKWVALHRADLRDKGAVTELLASEQDLMLRVSTAYFAVLAAADNVDFAISQKKQFAEQLAHNKEKFKVGLLTLTEVSESKASFDESVAAAIAARNALANSREALRTIIKVPVTTLARLQSNIAFKAPSPKNINAWVDNARQHNLSLQAARYKRDVANDDIRIQKAGHLPTVTLSAQLERETNTANSLHDSTRDRSVTLDMSLPLFSGGGTVSAVNKARFDYQTTLHDLDKTQRRVENSTRDAYRGVLAAISRIKALKQAQKSREIALKATQAGFKEGTKTNLDVLDRIADLFAARKAYAQSRYDYITHLLHLKQASGTINMSDLQHINAWLDNGAS